MVSVILLDLHKAFDLKDPDNHLHKLKLYKYLDHTIRTFTSYLKSSSQ